MSIDAVNQSVLLISQAVNSLVTNFSNATSVTVPLVLNINTANITTANITNLNAPGFGGGYGINVTANSVANLVGDGVTDNSANWATLVASLATPGALLYWPKGKYFFNASISYSYPASNVLFDLSFVGDGQDATVINFASGFGLTITFNNNNTSLNNQSFHARDLSFTASGTGTSTGVTLTQATDNNGDYTALTELTRVTFRGDDGYVGSDYFNLCVLFHGVSNVNVIGCGFFGRGATGGTGIKFEGINGSNVAAVLNAYGSTFALLVTGVSYGDFMQGVTFSNCNWSGCTTGIFVPGSLTGIGAQLAISDCQFGIYTSSSNGIVISTALNNLSIVNTLFLQNVATTGGVVLAQTSNTIINGCEFQSLASAAGNIGISLSTSTTLTGVTVTNNVFTSYNGTNSFAWVAQNSVANAGVTSAHNAYINCHATPFSDLSTGPSASYDWITHNTLGDFAFIVANANGSAGDHGMVIRAGATSGTVDASTVLVSFTPSNGVTTLGSITRNGATTISLNGISNITGASMTVANVDTILSIGTNNILRMTSSATVGNFGFLIENPVGSAGDDGINLRCGANVATDALTVCIEFARGNGATVDGSITRNNAAIAYNTTSDARRKENIVLSERGLDIVKNIPVREFNWAGVYGDPIQGLIGQELVKYYPDAVRVGGDDPDKKPWGVDYGRLTPLLLRAIQELAGKVETLEKNNVQRSGPQPNDKPAGAHSHVKRQRRKQRRADSV